MPIFEIEAPNGQLLEVEGDNAPTEQEARDIFINTIGGSQDKPINKSPLSSKQRVALSFGTSDGNLDYLKRNYEDAINDPNEPNKYLVQQGGLWHKVDEEGITFGDVEDAVGKGMVALTSAIGEIGGGIAGTAAAPGVGTVAGLAGGAGVGGAAGEFLRQKIGQQMGTVTKDDINELEVVTEGALGTIGAGFGVALSKFGGKALQQAVKKVNTTRVPKAVSSYWDSVIGVSDGVTDTLLRNTDEVTNFKKWSGANRNPRAIEIADNVVEFVKDTKSQLKQIKRVASNRANELGITVQPENILNTVDDITGESLQDQLVRYRVIAPDDDPLKVSSPMIKKLTNLMQKETLSFDDLDTAIRQIDDVTKYGAIPDKEKAAEGALKKIRLALKNQRNSVFGVEENFDEMSGLIRSVQDADGRELFSSVKRTDSLLRNLDSAANIRNKEVLEQLAEVNPSFRNILDKRDIWKASNELNSLVPSTRGGYGSGAGRANALRNITTAGSAGIGGAIGGLPGVAVGGGLATLGFAPKTTARAVKAARLGQAGARLAGKTTGATTRQGAVRLGMSSLGL